MREELPWWMQEIIGFEDDPDKDPDEDSDEEDEDEEDQDDEDDADDDEDEKSKKKSEPSAEGLKSALRKERMERKRLERRIRKLTATKAPAKPKEGEKPAEGETPAPEAKVSEKLVLKLRDQAIDSAITRFAVQAGFEDPEDAVKLVRRKDIEFDQDEDDPSEIEVDDESVQDAVTALAKAKPRLLATKSERQRRSGSKFGGKTTGKKTASDEALRDQYPALRR